MIRVALPLFGRGRWTGGIVYLKNTLTLIRRHLHEDMSATLLLSPAQFEQYGADLAPAADDVAIDGMFEDWGRGLSLIRALLLGADRRVDEQLKLRGIDVVLENASSYGWHTSHRTLVWFPDFQHRLLPDKSSQWEWWRRELGFRLQLATAQTIMLSSESAREDCERLYPVSRGRIHVVRFAADIDPAKYLSPSDDLRAKYALQERFFFLPNQFWRHKNYEVLIDALEIIAHRGLLEELPVVILSGRTDDDRSTQYHAEIMAKVEQRGLAAKFRHIGFIPYDDVLRMSGCCHALINPSLFEGWSTPIEEAKALDTPLVLSDLPVHKEQAPNAAFFARTSAADCAEVLLAVARRPSIPRLSNAELARAQERRVREHALAFLAVIRTASSTRS